MSAIIALSFSAECLAETFFWEEDEKIYTTDDISKVPLKFRNNYEKFKNQNSQNKSIKHPSSAALNNYSAILTLKGYLQAKNWQDRIKYVLDEDRVRPFMERYYASDDEWKVPKFSIITKEEPPVSETGWAKIDVRFSDGLANYYLKKQWVVIKLIGNLQLDSTKYHQMNSWQLAQPHLCACDFTGL